ncbi:helix-turn-helix domain-containing protein [Butyricicoccus sp.]|uniref:helix-turn-helix domain-containing protein n=1 Tax=Butyricicoccus sp. TaxID=2049021 RepID=UPI003F183FBD
MAAPDLRIAELLWIPQAVWFDLAGQESCSGIGEADETMVVAVKKGELYVDCSCIQGQIYSGQSFVLPVNQKQGCHMTAKTGSSCIVLSLSGTLVEQVLGEQFGQNQWFYPNGLTDVLETANVLHTESIGQEEISSAAYQLLMRLYQSAQTYQENRGYPLLVQAAIGIIQEEFARIDGVDEIADRLEVTRNHLIRLFTPAVGISPGRYLKLRRIAYAKELLMEPDMSVSLAAVLSGFSNTNYFAKVFRKETGTSPREYMAAHAGTIYKPGHRQMDASVYC